MKPSEAAALLTVIARTDKRTFGEPEAISWSELMTKNDVPLPDAIEAVADHFGSSHDYLMPIHIIERARGIRRERLTRAGDPPMPADLTWAQEKEWRQLWCGHVKNGMTPADAAKVASRSMELPSELEKVDMPDYARAAIAGFALAHSVPRIEGGQR